MTDLTREQIEALLKGTTPGDWSVAADPCHYDTASDVVCGKNLHASVGGEAVWREQEANTRIMAAAPNLARQCLSLMDERDEAQAAQAGVVEMCAEVPRKHAKHLQKNGLTAMSSDFDHIETDIRSLADPTGVKLLAELRARAEKGAEVNVKTLSWTEGKFCGQDMFFADTPFGAWMVVRYSGRDFRWAICDPLGNDSDEDWSTPELAMAAAQGDHIARVRAALSAAPTGEGCRAPQPTPDTGNQGSGQ